MRKRKNKVKDRSRYWFTLGGENLISGVGRGYGCQANIRTSAFGAEVYYSLLSQLYIAGRYMYLQESN
jgi:hypothetical protein